MRGPDVRRGGVAGRSRALLTGSEMDRGRDEAIYVELTLRATPTRRKEKSRGIAAGHVKSRTEPVARCRQRREVATVTGKETEGRSQTQSVQRGLLTYL